MNNRAKLVSVTNETTIEVEDDKVGQNLTFGRALFAFAGFGLLGLGLAFCSEAPVLAFVLGLFGILGLCFAQVSDEHFEEIRDSKSFSLAVQAAARVSVRPDTSDDSPRPPRAS